MNAPVAHASQALDALAHDLRNHLNVLAMGVSLVSDEDGRDDLTAAVRSLQRNLERLITCARSETTDQPEQSTHHLSELLSRGLSRATREGRATADPSLPHTVSGLCSSIADPLVMGNALWLERLATDIWHLTSSANDLELTCDADQITILVRQLPQRTEDGTSRTTIAMMDQLAQTSGGAVQIIESEPSTLAVTLPHTRVG